MYITIDKQDYDALINKINELEKQIYSKDGKIYHFYTSNGGAFVYSELELVDRLQKENSKLHDKISKLESIISYIKKLPWYKRIFIQI